MRYLSATLAILSLLLALFLSALLIASFFRFNFYPVRLGPIALLFRSTHGLTLTTFFASKDWLPIATPFDYIHTFLGFGLARQTANAPAYTLFVPHWFLILCMLIHPYRFFRHTRFYFTRRHERLSQNQCPTCAYDLRMHKPGQICPECGTPIPVPPATT